MTDRTGSAGHMTNWAARLFARDMDRRLKALGVLPAQLPILLSLTEEGPLSQKALVRIAAVEQPSMVVNLRRMERDGLVERRADPADGRGTLFSLTPLARSKLDAVREAIREGNAEALKGFSDEEQARYLSFLERIIANLT